jgi:hypothetical protein
LVHSLAPEHKVGPVSWLDPSFTPPERLKLATGDHVRPLREADGEIDYRAVMGSRERLWERYGEAWGWPRESLSYEDDREDLARHEAEFAANQAFAYAILDDGETRVLGCLYVDPPEPDAPAGSDAVVSWWVIDDAVGGPLERALDDEIPRWLADAWEFRSVHYHP